MHLRTFSDVVIKTVNYHKTCYDLFVLSIWQLFDKPFFWSRKLTDLNRISFILSKWNSHRNDATDKSLWEITFKRFLNIF